MSETEKYRHLTVHYCDGIGLDIGSQGNPVVPWAMQVDLPHDEFGKYCGISLPESVQLPVGDMNLPFRDGVLDFVYSSHLLEDFLDWEPHLLEWTRVLKRGGKLVILIPDKARWCEAVKSGQPPNCAHKHEGGVGELSTYAPRLGLQVLEDRLTNLTPTDYSIIFAASKL